MEICLYLKHIFIYFVNFFFQKPSPDMDEFDIITNRNKTGDLLTTNDSTTNISNNNGKTFSISLPYMNLLIIYYCYYHNSSSPRRFGSFVVNEYYNNRYNK